MFLTCFLSGSPAGPSSLLSMTVNCSLTKSSLAFLPSLSLFLFSLTCALWDHLLNERMAPKSLSQGLLLGEPKLRHCSSFFFFCGAYPLSYYVIYLFICPLFIVCLFPLKYKPHEDRDLCPFCSLIYIRYLAQHLI